MSAPEKLSADGGQRQLNQGGHHAAGVMPRPVTMHKAGGAAVVDGAAGKRVRLDKNGVPIDVNDWTDADWLDLHQTMRRLIRRIARRHAAR